MSVYNGYKSPNFLKFKNKSIFNPLEEIDNKGLNLYEIYKNKKENKIYIAHTTTFKNVLNIYYLIDISKAELYRSINSEKNFFQIKYHSIDNKEYLISLTLDKLITVRDINSNFSIINIIKTNYDYDLNEYSCYFLNLCDKIIFNKKYYNILDNNTSLNSQFEYIEDIIPWENNDTLYIIQKEKYEIKIYDTKNEDIIYKIIHKQLETRHLTDERYCTYHFDYFEMLLYNKKNKNYLFTSDRFGIIQVYDLNNFKYVHCIYGLECMHVDPYLEEERDELGYPNESHEVFIKFYLYNENYIIFLKYERVTIFHDCSGASFMRKFNELYVFDVDAMKILSKYTDFEISDYEIKLMCMINNNS